MVSAATRSRRRACTLAVLACLAGTAACGRSAPSAAQRPFTPARLEILTPGPNEVTGADLSVRLQLTGAREVPTSQGAIRPDEGHIHLSLDGTLVAMTSGVTDDLHGLLPGPHSIQAEFVAVDHAPFRNRVVAAVLFSVRP